DPASWEGDVQGEIEDQVEEEVGRQTDPNGRFPGLAGAESEEGGGRQGRAHLEAQQEYGQREGQDPGRHDERSVADYLGRNGLFLRRLGALAECALDRRRDDRTIRLSVRRFDRRAS